MATHKIIAEYIWKVENFSKLENKVGILVDSPEFSAVGSEWHVQLYAGGEQESNAGHVSVFLIHHNRQDPFTVEFSIAIVNSAGTEFHASSDRFHHDYPGCGYPTWVPRSDLLNPEKGLLENDTLRLLITLTRPDEARGMLFLGRSLEKLLDSGELSARSEYFAALLRCAMREAADGVVDIGDTELPVFRQMLRFVYTGSCDFDADLISESDEADEKPTERKRDMAGEEKKGDKKEDNKGANLVDKTDDKTGDNTDDKTDDKKDDEKNDKNSEEKEVGSDVTAQLLIAADRFMLPELADVCANKLAKSINTTNAAGLLLLADQLNVTNLKQAVLDFCADSKNRAEVMNTADWQKLGLELVMEIMVAITPGAKPQTTALSDSVE